MKISLDNSEEQKPPDVGDAYKHQFAIQQVKERMEFLKRLNIKRQIMIKDEQGKDKLIDVESQDSQLMQGVVGGSYFFGGIGDQYPITADNVQAFNELWWQFMDSLQSYGVNDDETQYLAGSLTQIGYGLIGRSTSRQKDMTINTVIIQPPGYGGAGAYQLPTENMPPPPPPPNRIDQTPQTAQPKNNSK